MTTVKVQRSELVTDKNGRKYFKRTIEERDITGKEDRIYEICQMCTHGAYPECLKTCAGAMFARQRIEKENK